MLPPGVRGIGLLVALLVFCASAADLIFSGSLVRAGDGSISVRLADGRVIEARLPRGIPAGYKTGDQVQITCKPIEPLWAEDVSRYQFLELTNLRRLPRPSREEPSKAVEPAPPAMDAAARGKLEHAREVTLEYASNMPSFVADETARRYTGGSRAAKWRYFDIIETEIAFRGARAVRQDIRRNGRRWGRPFEALPGFKWYGGFGTEIGPLFGPRCPTTIEYRGRSEMRGKQLLEYRFGSPSDGCFPSFYFEYQRYNPARTGHVWIDDPSGRVVRLDEEAGHFPDEFPFAQRNEEVSWDYVKIGDASHWLPVTANFVVLYSSGARWRVEVEYRNHRHSESSTNIPFPRPTAK